MWTPDNWPAFLLSWSVMLLWIGIITYMIDQIGNDFGWWKNDD
jgi:hypothetical protein